MLVKEYKKGETTIRIMDDCLKSEKEQQIIKERMTRNVQRYLTEKHFNEYKKK